MTLVMRRIFSVNQSGEDGIRTEAESAEKSSVSSGAGANSGARGVTRVTFSENPEIGEIGKSATLKLDPDLQAVLESLRSDPDLRALAFAWPGLSEGIKDAIVVLATGTGKAR